MFLDIAGIILGFVLLALGAEGLVRGSASVAIRVGVTPLTVGLTVVALGTSTPELVVSLSASLNDQADIAIGNVVGSNIFNIGIILGLAALLCPIKVNAQVVKHDGPIMIAASLILLLLLTLGSLSRLSGIGLFTALIAYTTYTIGMSKKEASHGIQQQFEERISTQSKSLCLDLLFIGGGLLLLVIGSRFLIVSATDIALSLGVSEAVIGLTIIAAGTGMPELATSLVAALRNHPDIAVGNIVGSNIFNILGILGISSIVKPLSAPGITALDLWVMVAFAIALLLLLYTKLKLQRWEGGLLMLGYAAYLWVLWPSN